MAAGDGVPSEPDVTVDPDAPTVIDPERTPPTPLENGDRISIERNLRQGLASRMRWVYLLVGLAWLTAGVALGMAKWSLNVQLERTREKARAEFATTASCK